MRMTTQALLPALGVVGLAGYWRPILIGMISVVILRAKRDKRQSPS